MTRDDIPTPALLLDLDRFERNLRRMAAHARASGKNLRPHAKTHRCPEIARRQVSAGALGVACAKLGEAEVMARAGVRGLLITTEVVSPAAIRRLMRLVSAAPDTMVVIDNPGERRGARPRGGGRWRDGQRAGGRRRGNAAHRHRPGRARARAGACRRRPAGAPLPRAPGLRGSLRARHGLGGAARGLARGAEAADGDARADRASGYSGRDRRRRLDRHLGTSTSSCPG